MSNQDKILSIPRLKNMFKYLRERNATMFHIHESRSSPINQNNLTLAIEMKALPWLDLDSLYCIVENDGRKFTVCGVNKPPQTNCHFNRWF